MTNEITLKDDRAGAADVQIKMSNLFVTYLLDMAEIAGGYSNLEKGKIFDLDEIITELEKNPGLKVRQIASPNPEELNLVLDFANIEEIFYQEKALSAQSIIYYSNQNDLKTISLHLNRNNFGQVAALFPILSNPVFESLGPMQNENTSEEEYLEIMEFALGEEGPGAIEEAKIIVIINVSDKIISQEGGTIDGKSVTFVIPLIRILLLDKPLSYRVVYR